MRALTQECIHFPRYVSGMAVIVVFRMSLHMFITLVLVSDMAHYYGKF